MMESLLCLLEDVVICDVDHDMMVFTSSEDRQWRAMSKTNIVSAIDHHRS